MKLPIVYLVFISLIFIGCDAFDLADCATRSIESSKEKGLFVCELYPEDSVVKINDSIKIRVYSAWIEKQWNCRDFVPGIFIDRGYQILLITDTQTLNDYSDRFTIGITSESYFLSLRSNSLVCNIDSLPLSKELTWHVQRKYQLHEELPHDTIGIFKLKVGEIDSSALY
jgi:hypothetical protein